MPKYRVAYEITFQGFTIVEAETPEDARELVTTGDFDDTSAQQRTDWKPIGPAVRVAD